MTPSDIAKAVRLVLAMLEKFEGLFLRPYLCPAGVPTIGLGTTRYPNGKRVSLSDPPITREYAYEIAKHQLLQDYIPAVVKLCTTLENDRQLSAIVDFTYNLGIASLRSSNLLKCILRGEFESVPYQLRRWVKGGGRTLKGLVRRREFEILIWSMR